MISTEYKKALAFSIVLQILLFGLAGLIHEFFLVILCIPLIAYWVIAVLTIFRRPSAPTKDDLFIVRTGFPFFLLLAFALSIVFNWLVGW